MNYTKPEILDLGDAALVIQSHQKPGTATETQQANSAYDIDE
jgi:hypothetical protein